MGMFDTVRCAYPLPRHQDEEFQTKDLAHLVHGEIMLGGLLDHYEITGDGRLRVRRSQDEWIDDPEAFFGGYSRSVKEWWEDLPDVHGDIRIYTSVDDPEGGRDWVELSIRFTHGAVERVSEVAAAPAVEEGQAPPDPHS